MNVKNKKSSESSGLLLDIRNLNDCRRIILNQFPRLGYMKREKILRLTLENESLGGTPARTVLEGLKDVLYLRLVSRLRKEKTRLTGYSGDVPVDFHTPVRVTRPKKIGTVREVYFERELRNHIALEKARSIYPGTEFFEVDNVKAIKKLLRSKYDNDNKDIIIFYNEKFDFFKPCA